jgi:hypothetical protein
MGSGALQVEVVCRRLNGLIVEALERSSTRQGLDPAGKLVPYDGLADRYPDLLDEDQEGARPERRTVNLAGGPEVVGHHQKKKYVGKQGGRHCISMDYGKGPTGDGGDHQSNGCDKDEALMR